MRNSMNLNGMRSKHGHFAKNKKDVPLSGAFTDVPIEERIKLQVSQVGTDAVNTLKRTYDLVLAAMQSQHHQYERIFTTIQSKSDRFSAAFQQQNNLDLQVRSSRSFEDIRMPGGDMLPNQRSGNILGPVRSRSTTSVLRNTDSSEALTITVQKRDFFDKTTLQYKDGVQVGLASIPKKGNIALTTHNILNVSDLNSKDHVLDKVRKTRPTPMSRQKLISRQRDLVDKNTKKERHVSGHRHANKRGGYELPDSLFGGYTVGELEKKVLDIANPEKSQTIINALENFGFPKRALPQNHSTAIEDNKHGQTLPPLEP